MSIPQGPVRRLTDLVLAQPGMLVACVAVFCLVFAALLAEQYALILGGGLLLLAFAVFLQHPRWLYVLIIALVPFWGLRNFGGVNLQWVLGMMLLLILALSSLPRKALPEQLSSRFWSLFALLLAIFVLSAWQSQYPDTAWTETFLLLSAYLYIAVGFVYIDRSLYTVVLPRVILVTVSIGSAAVFLDYLFDPGFLPAHPRGYGLSNNTNNVAKMAIFTLPLIVYGLRFRKFFRRGTLLGLLALNTSVVVVTFSRSGFLILLIALAMIAFQYRASLRPRRLGAVVAGLALVGIVAALAIPQSFWQRQLSLLEFQDSSLQRRIAYLHIGRESFVQAPILGSGPGTFKDIYSWSARGAAFLSDDARNRRYQLRETKVRRHAHNGYLEILVGTGLVGFAVYLGILLMVMSNFIHAIRRFGARGDVEMAALTSGYLIAYGTLLIYLAVGSLVFHKYLLLAIALSEVARRLAAPAHPVHSGKTRAHRQRRVSHRPGSPTV